MSLANMAESPPAKPPVAALTSQSQPHIRDNTSIHVLPSDRPLSQSLVPNVYIVLPRRRTKIAPPSDLGGRTAWIVHGSLRAKSG